MPSDKYAGSTLAAFRIKHLMTIWNESFSVMFFLQIKNFCFCSLLLLFVSGLRCKPKPNLKTTFLRISVVQFATFSNRFDYGWFNERSWKWLNVSVADNATAKRHLQLSVNKDTKLFSRVISSSFNSFSSNRWQVARGALNGSWLSNVDSMGNFSLECTIRSILILDSLRIAIPQSTSFQAHCNLCQPVLLTSSYQTFPH